VCLWDSFRKIDTYWRLYDMERKRKRFFKGRFIDGDLVLINFSCFLKMSGKIHRKNPMSFSAWFIFMRITIIRGDISWQIFIMTILYL
jgi:hypothetical protein